MKLLLIITFLFIAPQVLAGNPPLDPTTDKGLQTVFDREAIPTLTITVPVDQWNLLLANFDANARNEEKVKASFLFEKGEQKINFSEIGFRIRGNLSRKRPEGKKGEFHNATQPRWHQAHFKVDFKKYQKGQNLMQLRGLNLKFFNNDPSHVREVFCYQTLRDFGVWTTPFSSYARLYIQVGEAQPAYFGIYQMVEQIDKRYLQVRFGKKGAKGFLWKCLYQRSGPADLRNDIDADSPKIGTERIELDEKKSFRPSYDLKTGKKRREEAINQFLQFLDNLNGLEGSAFERWFEQTFDTDQFLRFLAANTLLGMWDDYWVNANNYYLYMHPAGKVFFIPYDYDNTLGTSHIVYNSGTQNVFHWGPVDGSRPLVYKVLSIPRHKATYAQHLKSLLDEKNGLLDPQRAMARVRAMQEKIQPFVACDVEEPQKIVDKPADWARKPFYRLLSGDDLGQGPESNYFATRARFAKEQLGQ